MIKTFFTLAYPFCFFVCSMCDFSPFAMIINLLVWADVGTPRGHQGDGDSAA